MNYNKIKFSPEQILEILCVENTKNAPVETPFFMLAKHKDQKEYLLQMMEQTEPEKFREILKTSGAEIHIEYWWKYKDGGIHTKGAHLEVEEVEEKK